MGAPPGFSSGDTWTMPLVDPLADGRLLVPVRVHGHGPYLFAIDRDRRTTVDPQVINETGVPIRGGGRLDDYSDTTHPAYYAELTDVEIGSLTISLMPVNVVAHAGVFDEDGRRIAGILGDSALADSLVFGFDRDRGIAWLQTEDVFHPPPDAAVLETTKVTPEGGRLPYWPMLVGAKVGDVPVGVHADFWRVSSELAPARWSKAGLHPGEWELAIVDEAGISRREHALGTGSPATVGAIKREGIGFAPFDDRRLALAHVDGTLGLDFFRPYKVASDWHHEKMYLSPRADDAPARAARLARWGAQIPACPHPGCVDLALEDQILHVRPDPGAPLPLEVVVRATSTNGTALPNLYRVHGRHARRRRRESVPAAVPQAGPMRHEAGTTASVTLVSCAQQDSNLT